jgi:hypothetical protein
MANDDDLRDQDFAAEDGDVYDEEEFDIIGLGPDTNMNERGGDTQQRNQDNQDQQDQDNQ